MFELNEREKNILRNVIQQFILTASPVGSKNFARQYTPGLSPATIRSIMSDLEESGYLDHPHTSAGRIPTDKGYRFYVDNFATTKEICSEVQDTISRELETVASETDELLRVTSILLSDITNQLACVTYPKLDTGILEKLQIVQLTGSRILVVVSIKSGLIKTLSLELNAEVRTEHIIFIQDLINERLSGLTFIEIRKTFNERFRDISGIYKPIIRVFIDSADKIFTDLNKPEKMLITGTKNILRQPEFEKSEQFQSIIELIEDKDVIVHIMDKTAVDRESLIIKIGSEISSERLSDFSLISKEYTIGEVTGRIGVMGPKRMEYSKVIASVIYVAEMLNEFLKKGTSK
jgi:heat-inducible transcriptional repressor